VKEDRLTGTGSSKPDGGERPFPVLWEQTEGDLRALSRRRALRRAERSRARGYPRWSRALLGGLVLLGCAVGGAVVTLAMLTHFKSAGEHGPTRDVASAPVPARAPEVIAPAAPVTPAEAPGSPTPASPATGGSSPSPPKEVKTPVAKPVPNPPSSASSVSPAPSPPPAAKKSPERRVQPAEQAKGASRPPADQPKPSAASRPPAEPAKAVAATQPAVEQSKARPAPQAAGARPSADKSYWVQIGVFTSAQMARQMAAALQEQEPPGSTSRWVVTVDSGSGTSARVRVGPFPDRSTAESRLKQFQDRGYKPSITTE